MNLTFNSQKLLLYSVYDDDYIQVLYNEWPNCVNVPIITIIFRIYQISQCLKKLLVANNNHWFVLKKLYFFIIYLCVSL